MRIKDAMRIVDTFLVLFVYFPLGLLAITVIPFMFVARIGKRMINKGRKVNWFNPEVWF